MGWIYSRLYVRCLDEAAPPRSTSACIASMKPIESDMFRDMGLVSRWSGCGPALRTRTPPLSPPWNLQHPRWLGRVLFNGVKSSPPPPHLGVRDPRRLLDSRPCPSTASPATQLQPACEPLPGRSATKAGGDARIVVALGAARWPAMSISR